MEPEKNFLENAAIMAAFAQKEIKQFLAWTSKTADYRPAAEVIASDLARAILAIKELQKHYDKQ